MKVIIVDDEKAMHLIMKRMLGKFDEVEIIGSFQETLSAFSFLTNNKVDLIFVDINMKGENGLAFSKRIRACGYHSKLVFVTSHKEYALSAFDVFAFDYIVKPISEERVRKTVQRANSEIVKGPPVISLNDPEVFFVLIDPLTKRELEVLKLISNGMINKEIALGLSVKEGTIKNHIVNIFSKLDVKNRVQAIKAAKNFNLID